MARLRINGLLLFLVPLTYLPAGVLTATASVLPIDITRLTLEELMDIDVYTASRRHEPYQTSPNAIYVLTGEEIRRARVTSIPEALRLVPGVQVARVDANKWAVSIRGFNNRAANKLLVLVDGRSIYDPLFGGTLWESRDVMLEDLDRIEVIRGPGGALWGANAFNGVINIVTKHASATPGGLVVLGAGTEERAFGAARYGWETGAGQHARVYAKGLRRDTGFLSGADAADASRSYRAGFRWDWQAGARDEVRLSGDFFTADADEWLRGRFPPQTVGHDGGNLLGHWTRRWSATDALRVQAYYDRFRLDNLDLGEERDTIDLEVQRSFARGDRHLFVAGLGYRNSRDDIRDGRLFALDPSSRKDVTTNVFVQDTITVAPDKWYLTLGTKLERNNYTGVEWQPNARLAWTPDAQRTWWTSIARAVRVPSRLEADIVSGGARSGDAFEAERVYAYEVGYRRLVSPRVWYDVAGFYNQYRGLLTVEPPFVFQNWMDGHTYGVEVAARWQPRERWRLDAAYTHLRLNLRVRPQSGANPAAKEGAEPRHQFVLHSAYDFTARLALDATLRFVDDLRSLSVPSYTMLDLGISWFPRPQLEVSLVGQNLTDSHHAEVDIAGSAPTLGTEVERGFYTKLTWKF